MDRSFGTRKVIKQDQFLVVKCFTVTTQRRQKLITHLSGNNVAVVIQVTIYLLVFPINLPFNFCNIIGHFLAVSSQLTYITTVSKKGQDFSGSSQKS